MGVIMSDQMAGNAAPTTAVDDAGQENVSSESIVNDVDSKGVQYETHKRVVAKAKNWQSRAEQAEQKAVEVEQALLQAEGKKDELIDNLRKQLVEKDTRLKSTVGNFAYSSLTAQLEAEAAGVGCVDVKALSKLVDLSSVSVDDESFMADGEQLKILVDDAKKTMPYLFSKAGPKINTRTPGGSTESFEEKQTDYSKMSADELVAEAERIDGLADKKIF
jgi:hypothetical protein